MPRPDGDDLEHLDVLVVGAGLSGIGAACYLRRLHPQRSVAILEARGATGGTWDLFRYPGARSDSDLFSFGYAFAPWRHPEPLASAERILAYVRETAAEFGVDRLVRFHTKVLSASWSSGDARWTVEVEDTGTGKRSTLTCSWLFCAAGYFRYDTGFSPELPGRERFRGPVIHPQDWPAELDWAGRRVVVIGSGATAVTLVPALARTARHVTMLQRTPSYVLPVPSHDPVVALLRRVLGEERAHPLLRWRSIAQQRLIWRACRRFPRLARRVLRRVAVRHLPPGYPVEVHFAPPYRPWDQRLCIVPDGDLFAAIREGSADVVTDRIDTFTETGIRLESGAELEADVIVTATGLAVQAFGSIELRVDGTPVDLPRTVAYKGMMLSGVPNFAYAIGYTNASWTLKVGLVCEHLCRLLSEMDARGYAWARPVVRDPDMPARPILDFAAGYVQRAVDQLPRQGDRPPWTTSTDYYADVRLLRDGPVADDELEFGGLVPALDEPGDRFCDLPSGMRICYRLDGPADGEPVLLLAGLGLDLTSWPREFVDGLVAKGFRVIRLDNRDIGRSTRVPTPPPGRLRLLFARPRPDAYDLGDMAEDALGVLDALGVERAHLVGMSMGGMIAQVLAARHPARVATLTSVFSTTGARRVGQPARTTLAVLARPAARTRDQAVARHLAVTRAIGSTAYPLDAEVEAAYAGGAWDRAGGRGSGAAVARQISAIQASGDRTSELRRITAPTLVVHGDVDRMVHPSGGRATAAAVPGARHVEIAGMRHHLAPGLVDRLVDLVCEHAWSARPAERRA